VGDLLYANTTTTLAKLPDVATGNALISGGVGVAPSYGKIGLTTHVSGTLPTANGGTNLTSFTANGILYASSTSALATGSALTFDGTNFATTGTGSFSKLTTTNSTDVVIENIISQPNALYYSALTLQNTGASGKSYQLTVGGNTSAVPSGMYVYNVTNGNVPVTLVDASNNLTVGLGNVVIGTSGKGIDFSATPGTGTSELLADYEEGDWTPVFSFGTPGNLNIVYSSQVGKYTRIGRTVHVEMTMATTTFTHTTATGNASISGLPFTIGGTDTTTLTGACGGYVNATYPILGMQFFPTVATIFLVRGGPGAGAAATFLDFPSSGNLYITFQATYIV
jgi:hypothetical protein